MQSKLVIGGVVLALILGVAGLLRTPAKTIRETIREIGAVSNPELSSPFWTVNQVETRYYSSNFNQASTTICSFKTPGATSTLVFGSAQIDTATVTAMVLEMGKDPSLWNATTTQLGYTAVAGGQKGTLIASTTPRNGLQPMLTPDWVFAPNSYFNVKYGGPLGALNTLVGTCKAEFLIN